jgi:glycosyltransferase involved in cell wall biosynthesis
MRFCFVTNSVISSHATMKRAFGMAGPLLAEGHEVSVIMEEHPHNRERAEAVPGLEVLAYPATPGLLPLLRRKNALLKGRRFDVVHLCGLGYRNLVSPRSCPGARFVMDHVELESSMPGHSFLTRRLKHLAETWAIRRYPLQVAASRWLQAHVAARSPSGHEPLYLPYASEAPARLPADAGAALRERAAGRRVVLYLGGIYRAYGVHAIVEAAEQVLSTRGDLLFAILGQGPDLGALRSDVDERGIGASVWLPGFVPETEVYGCLAAADVFLAPLHDTVTDRARCPSKLFTYMAYGRPIVTSRIGEAPVYLGEHGFYGEPGSGGMAAQVLRALEAGPQAYGFPLDWASRVRDYLAWLSVAPGAEVQP